MMEGSDIVELKITTDTGCLWIGTPGVTAENGFRLRKGARLSMSASPGQRIEILVGKPEKSFIDMDEALGE